MTVRTSVLRFVHPLPYGAIVHDGGIQFVVFSRRATAMRVLLYKSVDDPDPTDIVEFDPDMNRWGDIWSVFVPEVGPGQLYHFQADGPFEPKKGLLFDGKARLIDPYAKALAGNFLPAEDGILRPPKCVVVNDEFDWQGDRHLRRSLDETVIYEMHVRGFTCAQVERREPSGHVPGTDREDSLPAIAGRDGRRADAGLRVSDRTIASARPCERPNYWGYDPLAFFAPHRGYAVGGEPGVPGPRVQGDGAGVAPGGHRSDPRRGVQPHGRRERERSDAELQGPGKPRLLHAGKRRRQVSQLLRAAATRSTATTRSSAR